MQAFLTKEEAEIAHLTAELLQALVWIYASLQQLKFSQIKSMTLLVTTFFM